MTLKEKMHLYGITEEDMSADVASLPKDILRVRFELEFDAKVFVNCFATGKPGHFDGNNFRFRPENQTDEDELKLIKESLRQKKNLFVEQWTNVAHYKSDVEY